MKLTSPNKRLSRITEKSFDILNSVDKTLLRSSSANDVKFRSVNRSSADKRNNLTLHVDFNDDDFSDLAVLGTPS